MGAARAAAARAQEEAGRRKRLKAAVVGALAGAQKESEERLRQDLEQMLERCAAMEHALAENQERLLRVARDRDRGRWWGRRRCGSDAIGACR